MPKSKHNLPPQADQSITPKRKTGKKLIKAGALLTLSLVLFIAYSFYVKASIPDFVNYQGRLRDNGGNPITAPTTIQFSLYSHITNGAPGDVPGVAGPLLWTETYDQANGSCAQITPGTDGIFAQHLGDCVPFPAYLDFTQEYYLGVKIGADAEASPRVPLSTHPYAFTSKRVHVEAGDLFINNTDATGNILMNTAGGMSITGSNAGFQGALYGADYSANYTNRSLVDKEYVDNQKIFGRTGTIISNEHGDYATDNFVFGSASMDDVVGTDDDNRMFFNKTNGSFRVGRAMGNQWDSGSIGSYSFATGEDTVASGKYSIAMMVRSVASGAHSIAMGVDAVASGDGAVAMGEDGVISSGIKTMAFGSNIEAHDSHETVFGTFNNIATGDQNAWVGTDRLFTIGNGINAGNRSNAMTILKNGNVGIGELNPDERTVIDGNLHTLQTEEPKTKGILSKEINSPSDLHIVGDYAYVLGHDDDGLYIIDIADKNNPQKVGFTNNHLKAPTAVFVSGEYAFVVAEGSNNLAIFDISNASKPIFVGEYDNKIDMPRDVYVTGNRAYVVNENNNLIVAIDITDPVKPATYGAVDNPIKGPFALWISGEYLYTIGRDDNMSIFDINESKDPVFQGQVNVKDVRDIYVSGKYAYCITGGNNELIAIDVTDPTHPIVAGTTALNIENAASIWTSGEYAYVVGGKEGSISIYDIADVNNMQHIVTENGPIKRPGAVFVDGIYAYSTSDGEDNMIIYELNHTKTPNFTTGSANIADLQVEDNAQFDNDIYVWGGVGVGNDLDVQHNLSVSGNTFMEGLVGIQTVSPQYALQVGEAGDGTQARANAWNTFSDRRYKKNIFSIESALDKVLALEGVNYEWKNGGDKTIGFIAQDVRKILPEVVSEDDEGYLSMDYSKLTPLLVNAVKEQNQIITNNTSSLTNLNLQTSQNIETLTELQASVDSNLTIVNQSLIDLDKKIKNSKSETEKNSHDIITNKESIEANTETLATLSENINSLTELTTNLTDTVEDHETRIAQMETILAEGGIDLSAQGGPDSVWQDFSDNLTVLKEEGKGIQFTLDGTLVVKKLEAEEGEMKKVSIEELTIVQSQDEDAQLSGMAVIKSGDTEVVVETKNVNKNDNILITPRAIVTVGVMSIQDGKEFIIKINEILEEDLKISWLIIKNEEQD